MQNRRTVGRLDIFYARQISYLDGYGRRDVKFKRKLAVCSELEDWSQNRERKRVRIDGSCSSRGATAIESILVDSGRF